MMKRPMTLRLAIGLAALLLPAMAFGEDIPRFPGKVTLSDGTVHEGEIRTTGGKPLRLYEADELYDLRDDPAELNNRIDDPSLSDVLAQLKERLLTFYLGTGDVVPHDTDRRR